MMKYFYNIITKLFVDFCFVCLLVCFSFNSKNINAQQLAGINKIFLIGQVINQVNGGPIKNQQVFIASDSTYNPDFVYHSMVYTDSEGYFYDSILTFANKGALLISTNDYLNTHHDTTVYFRFNWSEENILFPNFILPVEPPQVIYQANFYYLKNPSGLNTAEYQFFDISNVTNIIKREWSFGDGTFSDEINPVHKFTSTGLFRITLTITIQLTPNSIPIVSSIVKIINVTVKSYFYLGGHVMAGYFPIDYGEAYLYKIENKELVLIDTAYFNDTLGYYLFYQVIEGDYIVKAGVCPNSVHLNHYIETYYSNKYEWNKADTIHHTSNGCEYNIELIAVNQFMTGNGTVSGMIAYGFDPDKGKAVPAVNVEILLLNENNIPVLCGHSNEEGLFSFNDVNMGSYKIHAEVTGKYTYPVHIVLDETYPMCENIMLTIGAYTVNGNVNSISETNLGNNFGQPYPNPAGDHVCIDVEIPDSNVLILTIYNNFGQLIHSTQRVNLSPNTPVKIDLEEMLPGVYFVKLSANNQETTRKFIKR